jgi:hypothetical protein
MEAVRCTECSETRWSLFPGSLNQSLQAPCDLCGGEMVIERRRTGAGPHRLVVERRRAVTVSRSGGRSSPELLVR